MIILGCAFIAINVNDTYDMKLYDTKNKEQKAEKAGIELKKPEEKQKSKIKDCEK